MNQEQIDRINALYRKSKAEGLTEEEKKEQALLRKQYVADVKKNLAAQLNNIDMVNPDGSVENLGDKYGKRQDFPDAALTQEKARQQIRARHKAWRMELPQEEVQEKAERSVRGWRRLTGIITALSSTAIIRSARRLTVCRFWHRHFRTARRWRFRLHQKSGCSGTAAR